MACVTVVTWNKPLYNPNPPEALIACTYKLLKDKTAQNNNIIEVIRVNCTAPMAGRALGVIVDEYSGIAINNEDRPIKSINRHLRYIR